MTGPAFPVFVGADSREEAALEVCRFSLLRRSTVPLYVRALRLPGLRAAGLYWREHRIEAGRMIDRIDGRPFSTEFSFSRFLVPALCGWEGWALFCDCDFLFRADVAQLLPLLDPHYAVMCCQQQHVPGEGSKMDGQVQSRYRRKNWSSFMAFNCGHRENRHLTVAAVNTNAGEWLHSFGWLDPDLIGDLPHQWNFIAGTTTGTPRAIHLTTGGPWLAACQDVAFAQEWRRERAAASGADDEGSSMSAGDKAAMAATRPFRRRRLALARAQAVTAAAAPAAAPESPRSPVPIVAGRRRTCVCGARPRYGFEEHVMRCATAQMARSEAPPPTAAPVVTAIDAMAPVKVAGKGACLKCGRHFARGLHVHHRACRG